MQYDVRADLDKRRDQVQDMFDHVAPRYDVMNELMTFGQVRRWRRITTAAIDPRPGERILDVAAGTGTSSAPLAAAGAEVTCCDLSQGMLAEGRKRYPELTFVEGDAMALPFPDAHFDAVTISYGLRNVEDTAAALREFRRVTKPGGRLVIAEFSTPTWAPFRVAYRDYLVTMIPALAKLASTNPSAYAYLAESIKAWPDQRALADLMVEAGWHAVAYKNLTGGIVALHRGWN